MVLKTFRWNAAKNKRLQHERGISFEEIVIAIGEGGLLDVLQHRNHFLKTIIPSRKAIRDYLRRSQH